jgi:hypothetical protein
METLEMCSLDTSLIQAAIDLANSGYGDSP